MTDARARVMFGVTVALLVPVLAFLVLSSTRPASTGNEVVAEFEDAFPLVEGMNVRVDGAIAGSVGRIAVDDQGLAEVTLRLDDEIEPPRADATAAIRQQDTTGDSYVAFEPGTAKRALREVGGRPTIPCDGDEATGRCPRTLVAPRFDDLLNAFGPAERTGIQLTLNELARAVDGRGGDLNRAALHLRPGLAAANRALADVNRQNAALRSVIRDAEAVTGQAASRSRSLGQAIDGLAGTLRATASQAPALDAALERLPATATQARSTLVALRRAATAGRPLAEELRDGAPQLATAAGRAPGFLGDLKSFLTRARPTLELTDQLAKAAGPTIEAQPTRVVTGPFDLAPAISNLLRGVLGEDETIEVLFNEKFGLGAVAQEPGNQSLYPPEMKDRHFVRTSIVLNCEGFGVPVKPGCLLDVLGAERERSRTRSRREKAAPQAEREPEKREAAPSPSPSRDPRPSLPKLPKVPQVEIPRLSPDPPKLPIPKPSDLPKLPLPKPQVPAPEQPRESNDVEGLLDFLLGS